jgi:hypothetical protein
MLYLRLIGSAIAFTSVVKAQVNLGTALSFAVLGGSAVTNTGPSIISGNVGVYPGSAISGFPPGIVVNGVIHMTDAVAAQAQADVTTAYNVAAGLPPNTDLTGQDLGGMTLVAGVYSFSTSAQLTGALVLDGQGDSSSVWVFQIGSTLTTATASSVILIGGASPCNVFWQVGSSATIGTTTTFVGNVLALTSITLVTGASSNGGLYARNGAVTLDTNNVNAGLACPAVQPTTTTTTITSTTTTTATDTTTTTTTATTTTTSTDSTTTTATTTATDTTTTTSTDSTTTTATTTTTTTSTDSTTTTATTTATDTTTTTATTTATDTTTTTTIKTSTRTSRTYKATAIKTGWRTTKDYNTTAIKTGSRTANIYKTAAITAGSRTTEIYNAAAMKTGTKTIRIYNTAAIETSSRTARTARIYTTMEDINTASVKTVRFSTAVTTTRGKPTNVTATILNMATTFPTSVSAITFTATCSIAPTIITSYGQHFFIETPCTTVLTATVSAAFEKPALCKDCSTLTANSGAHTKSSSKLCPTYSHEAIPVSQVDEPASESTAYFQKNEPLVSIPPVSKSPVIVTAGVSMNWPNLTVITAALFLLLILN